LKSIEQTVENGVPAPKKFRDPMPSKGGAHLSPSEVQSVAAYVWALNRQKTAKRQPR
jgi:mono/diheme cytochrome c family protein